jgi:hypothetical protein
MSFSKRPTVLGFVSIIPATSPSTVFLKASMSTHPSCLVLTTSTSKPAMLALAGFVPCAESGTIILFRGLPSLSLWYALIIRQPTSSPWAPAAGARLKAAMPVSFFKQSSRLYRSSKHPCVVSVGWRGCVPATWSSDAATSLTAGLYFIVQLPKGRNLLIC